MKTEVFKNEKIEMLNRFVQNTDVHIFLTGKAGTGKTTFLRNLAINTHKRMVVVAPTGVAAINAGGVTIHSFFQLPFGPIVPESMTNGFRQQPSPTAFANNQQLSPTANSFRQQPTANNQQPSPTANNQQLTAKINKTKLKIMRSLDLLVIDEISMVRADLLDAVDAVLRKVRHSSAAFGGVQLLMIGDIQQLAPVVRQNEWELLQPYYKSVYFFDSHVLQNNPYICVELDHIYRQNDKKFIDILNQVRNNCLDRHNMELLNGRFVPDFNPKDEDGYITLTTHNSQADDINDEKLNAIKSKSMTFDADITGIFPENAYPTKVNLELKVGAQVMFVKNDPSPEKRYYNGKIGKVVSYDKNEGLMVESGDDIINVTPVKWQNFEYSLNEETNEIEEKEIGSFTQIPLKTAWAITIHKSQGLTFDKVILNAEMAFTHGQVYVALSRCTSLEGLVLKARIQNDILFNDNVINSFVNKMPSLEPDGDRLAKEERDFFRQMILELFSFDDIEKCVNRLAKVIRENDNIFEKSTVEQIAKVRGAFREDVVNVSLKFARQVETIFAEQDVDFAFLQERIKKASHYFFEKANDLENVGDLINETDNKAVNVSVKTLLDMIKEMLYVKTACLDLVKNGFELEKYLEIKNKKTIESENLKSTRLKSRSADAQDKPLMDALMRWRKEKASELDKPEAQILPKTVLLRIVEEKPVSIKELKELSKLGTTRIKRFGADIINMVLDFKGFRQRDFDDDDSKRELNLSRSTMKTLELLDENLAIDEIAKERNLSRVTIESHIIEIVKNGFYDVDDFVDKRHRDMITEYFEETNDFSLSAARDVLGDEYTYFELKLVLGTLNHC